MIMSIEDCDSTLVLENLVYTGYMFFKGFPNICNKKQFLYNI